MTEEEEFEFAQAYEKEQAQMSAQPHYINQPTSAKLPEPLKTGLMEEPKGLQKGMRGPAEEAYKLLLRTGPGMEYPETQDLQKQFDEKLRKEEEVYQAQRSAHGDTGLDWDRMAGEAITTAPPVFRAARAFAPTSTLGRMGTGTASGMGYSQLMTNPEENLNPPASDKDYWDRQGGKAKVGAAIGAAFPLTLGLAGGVKKYVSQNIIDPWTTAGRKREADRFVRSQAADDRARISEALSSAKEQVPGSQPTAGQAIAQAQVPGDEFGNALVKLEQEVASTPVTGMPLKRQYAKQRKARKDIVDSIAKTDADLARAERLRDSTSDAKYGEAYKSKPKITTKITSALKPKPTGLIDARGNPIMGQPGTKTVTKLDKELKDVLDQPYTKQALSTANRMSRSEGISLRSNPTKHLHNVKLALDKRLSATGEDALSNRERRLVQKEKDKLIAYITKKNYKYEVARSLYAKQSEPINKMQVGNELRDALIKASTKETPDTYLGALRNAPRTMKRATGFKRFDELEDVLTPEQAAAAKSVGEDLVTSETAKGLTTGLKTVLGQLPSEVRFQMPKILSRPIVIANHVLTNMFKNTQPEYQKLLAQTLKDPMELHKALQLPVESARRRMAIDLVRELSIYSGIKSEEVTPEFREILGNMENR